MSVIFEYHPAAIKIQALYRKYIVRKMMASVFDSFHLACEEIENDIQAIFPKYSFDVLAKRDMICGQELFMQRAPQRILAKTVSTETISKPEASQSTNIDPKTVAPAPSKNETTPTPLNPPFRTPESVSTTVNILDPVMLAALRNEERRLEEQILRRISVLAGRK